LTLAGGNRSSHSAIEPFLCIFGLLFIYVKVLGKYFPLDSDAARCRV